MKIRRRCVSFALLFLSIALSLASAKALDRGADGEFDKRSSSHFNLYQDVDIDRTSGFRGSRRFEQQLLEVLEAAYVALDRQTGLRPARPIDVVVYDPGVYDGRFGGLFRFPSAGFYGGRVHIRGDTVVTDRLVRVLHHELFHAALDAAAPSFPHPAWLNEGLAEWFAARAAGKRSLSLREWSSLGAVAQEQQLFALAQMAGGNFAHLGPRGAALAYLQSYAFFVVLERTHGDRSVRDVLDRYLRTGDVERAFRRTYRADLARIEERYHAELLAGAWR